MAKQRTTNFWDRLGYLFNPDKREFSLSGNTSFEQFFNLTDDDFLIVSEETAKSLSAVYTCLEVRAQDFAALPKGVFSKSNKKTTHHTEHRSNTIINKKPNTYQNAYDFWYTISRDADSYGNGLALIDRDTRGNALAMHRLKPNDFIKIELTTEGLVYKFTGGVKHPGMNIFHLKSGSNDGVTGKSPLRTNENIIGLAQRQEKYAKDITGKKPPAILATEQTLKAEQIKDLQKQFELQKKSGKTPVLPAGIKYIHTILPAGDVELIESMRLTSNQIYGIYRVPPTIAQDYGNAAFNNPEHQALVYVTFGQLPKIIQAEQEIQTKLLNRKIDADKYAKVNVNGLLRGDIETRANFYREMLTHGVFSPNMVLELEDIDGYTGGDKRYVNAAMIPTDLVEGFWKEKGTPDAPVSNGVDTEDVVRKYLERSNGNGKH